MTKKEEERGRQIWGRKKKKFEGGRGTERKSEGRTSEMKKRKIKAEEGKRADE